MNDWKSKVIVLFFVRPFVVCLLVCYVRKHGRIQKVGPEGSNIDKVFFCLFFVVVDDDTNISGPSLARQQNAIYGVSLACR